MACRGPGHHDAGALASVRNQSTLAAHAHNHTSTLYQPGCGAHTRTLPALPCPALLRAAGTCGTDSFGCCLTSLEDETRGEFPHSAAEEELRRKASARADAAVDARKEELTRAAAVAGPTSRCCALLLPPSSPSSTNRKEWRGLAFYFVL